MACTLFTLYFTECVHSGSLQFVFTVPMGGWCFQKPRSAQEFGEDLDNEPRGYCTVRDQSSKCISTSLFSAFKSIRCPFPLVKTKCLLGCRSERRRSPPMMMLTSVLLKNTRGPFSLTKRKSSALYDPKSLSPPPFHSCWNCNWLNGINNCLVLITRLCFVPHNIYVHCILLSV